VKCPLCSDRFGNVGAWDVHLRIIHAAEFARRKGLFGASVSLASQDTLLKITVLEKAEEDLFEVEHKDILSQREPEDGESTKKKARGGAALRHL
jgi:hypothetical protein